LPLNLWEAGHLQAQKTTNPSNAQEEVRRNTEVGCEEELPGSEEDQKASSLKTSLG
jgi:hypothetical protein